MSNSILKSSNNDMNLCPAAILRGENFTYEEEGQQAIETLKAQKELHSLGIDYSSMSTAQMQIEIEAHNLGQAFQEILNASNELSKAEKDESEALVNIFKSY